MDEHKIPKVNNKSYTIYKVQLFDTNPFLLFTTTRERRRKKWSYGLIWIHLAFIGNFKRKWKHCIILRCALCALTRVYTIWGRKTTKRMEYYLWIYIWIGYLTMAYEKSLVLLLSVRICSTAFKGALSEYLEKHTWNMVRPCTKKHSTTRAKHSNKCNLWKHLLMKIRPSEKQSFHVVFLSLRLCYCKGLIVLIVFSRFSNPFHLFFKLALALLIIDINSSLKKLCYHIHGCTTINNIPARKKERNAQCTLISFFRFCNSFCHGDGDDDNDAHKLPCCKFHIPMKMFTN